MKVKIISTVLISLIVLLCYFPQVFAQDSTVIDSTLSLDVIEWWNYNDTITIGKYNIKQDSLVTMTKKELDDFIVLIRLLTITNLLLKDEVIDKLCIKYLPERLLKNNQ